ncbi:MAG: hypothetical protein SOH80_04425 [Eubacteriales bacterium]|jgi:hypothetical protein
MLSYVDGFTCTADDNKETMIISFLQSSPIISSSGEMDGTKQENIANVVMTMTAARNLAKIIEQLTVPARDAEGKHTV